MSSALYGIIAFLVLGIGSLIGAILTHLYYYGRYHDTEDGYQKSLEELRQGVSAQVLDTAARIKTECAEAMVPFSDDQQMVESMTKLIDRIDSSLGQAGSDPVALSRVAAAIFPSTLMTIGHLQAQAAGIAETRQVYGQFSNCLTQMTQNFWRIVQAGLGQGLPLADLEAIAARLSAAHQVLGEEGLRDGLPLVAEVLAEMAELAERFLPAASTPPKSDPETN